MLKRLIPSLHAKVSGCCCSSFAKDACPASESPPPWQVTCVYCRSKWAAEGGLPADGGAPVGEGGYVNLAAFSNDHQGVSMESLYPATYEWIGRPRGGRRSWGYR